MRVPRNYRYVISLVLLYICEIISATLPDGERNVTSHSQCRQPSKTTLDCSNLKLTSIPNDIPNTFLALDMSFNELQHLEDDSFAKCCMNLQDLNLSHNLISNLNRKTFKNLIDVRRIYLRNNSISEFDPYTFADLLNLEKLDLSMNQLELQSSSTGFIVQPNLKELNLDDCKLSYIPEGGFVGVTQLENLTLSENPFEDDLDTSSFASLTSLIKLRMPNISRNSICELCSKLTEIDAINFDNFNLSCFYLLSSDSIDCNIENAVVGIDSTDPPMTLPILNAIPPKPTARESSTISISSTTAPTKVPLPANNSQEVIETNDHSGQSVTTSTEVNHAVVDIENETIRYILVGIISATVMGIIIALICRADVCGVKTKICRSKKNNRRMPDDTVSPFEEIPLNTVNVNGKSTQGQG